MYIKWWYGLLRKFKEVTFKFYCKVHWLRILFCIKKKVIRKLEIVILLYNDFFNFIK